MAKPYKIPDFRKMYPEASEEVIAVLRTSERKMQYQEYDLKRARNIVDPKTGEKMLRILYGDYYKFQVWSEPGKGTEIEIAVPIERGGNYVESGSSR